MLSAQTLRWIARGAGTLVAAYWLLIALLSGVVAPEPLTWEGIIMVILILTAAISMAVAWWRERVGAYLLLASGLAHSTFALLAAGHNHLLAMLISGGPFLLVGALFLLAQSRARPPQPFSTP